MPGGEREENLSVVLLYFIDLFYKAGKDNNSTFVNVSFLVKKIEKMNPIILDLLFHTNNQNVQQRSVFLS